MSYELLSGLCESKLIPSKPSLKSWDAAKLRKLGYFYFLALRILLGHEETEQWAKQYCKKTISNDKFETWRNDGNDFYVLLYALTSDKEYSDGKISVQVVRDWLHHVQGKELDQYTQRLFNRLDGMFEITDSSLKSVRRNVMHWNDIDAREKRDLTDKLIQKMQTISTKCELLSQLKKISPEFNDDLQETASSGATGAASVASVVGGLGAGFDSNGHRGIYDEQKPVIIKRVPDKIKSKKSKV